MVAPTAFQESRPPTPSFQLTPSIQPASSVLLIPLVPTMQSTKEPFAFVLIDKPLKILFSAN